MAGASEGDTIDARRRAAPSPSLDEPLHLLVLDGDSATVHPLPRDGAVLIGRGDDVGVRVRDPSVSRQHAEVLLEGGEARIVDLGSHNGVRVNGQAVQGAQALQSGDVVSLGDVSLVFHAGERRRPTRPILGTVELRARLDEELERVASYERAVSVLALDAGPGGVPAEQVAASDALRLIDFAGRAGTALMLVLPELGAEEARAVGEQLQEQLRSVAPGLRAGVSSAPEDGLNAEALLAAARAAALAAPPGGLLQSGSESHQLDLGDRSVIVADPEMVQVYGLLRRLAPSDIRILIRGETGTGKENAARAVHRWSPRSGQPFVAVNCAAIPESLADSELFGHERGAFSGADRARAGLLEQSSGGTLFLDEVGDLPLAIQVKLLRALEEGCVTRLGGAAPRQVDLRVVAATNRNLEEAMKAGEFREDLYHRIAGATVDLPPLRRRPRELPLLVKAFLDEACARNGRAPLHVSAAAMSALGAHRWPGNVRELKKELTYVATVVTGSTVEPSDFQFWKDSHPAEPEPAAAAAPGPEPKTRFRPVAEELRELERARMCQALRETGGVNTRAAQLISMPLRTFTLKMRRYRITPGDWGGA